MKKLFKQLARGIAWVATLHIGLFHILAVIVVAWCYTIGPFLALVWEGWDALFEYFDWDSADVRHLFSRRFYNEIRDDLHG